MKILCIGRALFDIVASPTKTFPPRYSAQELEKINLSPGGGGAITANILRRLGHDVTLLSYVGQDAEGSFLCDLLEVGGVDTTHVIRSPCHRTLINVIAVDSKGNARYLMSQDSGSPFTDVNLNSIAGIESFDAIHISTINQFCQDDGEPLLTWLRCIRERFPQILVMADTSKLNYLAGRVTAIAAFVDFFCGNHVELKLIAERAALINPVSAHPPSDHVKIIEQLMNLNIRSSAIIKIGSQGAAYFDQGRVEHSPAFVVPTVRNENGAGDVFCAALLHGVMSKKSLRSAVEQANVVAACHLEAGLDFLSSSPIDLDVLTARASRWSRSRQMNADGMWWRFPQSTPGYAQRFNISRRLPDAILGQWIDAICQYGRINTQSRVLDAGCGTGRFAIPLQEKINCHVTGVDSSGEVISWATQASTRVTWIVGELEELDSVLPVGDDKFDCVWMSSVVEQVNDSILLVFSQIFNQLKDGGKFLIRFTSRELIHRINWFYYFSEARKYAYDSYLQLKTVIGYLGQTGFTVELVMLRDDYEDMSLAEFSERIRQGGFPWCHLYPQSDIEQSLSQLRYDFAGRNYRYQNPSYFIVATKASAHVAKTT